MKNKIKQYIVMLFIIIYSFSRLLAIDTPLIPDEIESINNYDAQTYTSEWVKAGYYDETNTQYNRDNLPDDSLWINVLTYDYQTNFQTTPDFSNNDYTLALDLLIYGIRDTSDYVTDISPLYNLWTDHVIVLYFPEGTYHFTKSIKFQDPFHKNIIIRGDGSDKTFFRFNIPQGSSSYDSFIIKGTRNSNPVSPYKDNMTSSYITNIGLEDFAIIRDDLDADYADTNNITINDANNCWVIGVECQKTHNHQLVVEFSKHITIRGCYFNDSLKHDEGGQGYGVSLDTFTHHCLVENNILRELTIRSCNNW